METRIRTLAILLSIVTLFVLYGFEILGAVSVVWGDAQVEFKWWNVSWRYRIKLEINSTNESRANWPIEYHINFTELIPNGVFDENSIRVIEYDSNGNVMYEVPSQFDKDDDFNPSTNAAGTLVFLMNGTTLANTKRIFYIYYDTLSVGQKEKPSYATNLSYFISSDNRFININTSILRIYIDTNRGKNVSGIYQVDRGDGANILNALPDDLPAEYVEYSNGTHNFTFDLRNNATVYFGPVRVIVRQEGYENTFGNPDNKTGELLLRKEYYIYDLSGPSEKGGFIKVKQIIKNIKAYSVERNSTDAGALAFDINRTFPAPVNPSTVAYNYNNPYSYVRAGTEYENFFVGVINLEQINTQNFFANNATATLGRIGIHLNSTAIPAHQSIEQTSLVYFGAFNDPGSEFEYIRRAASNPVTINANLPEKLYVTSIPETDKTIYNRNEVVKVKVRIAEDPYNLTKYVNVTFDMGTSDKSDDQTIILYDDGTHGDEVAGDKNFTNMFTIPVDGAVGVWTINATLYSENYEFLNSTLTSFNVTNILNVTLSIVNKKTIANQTILANLYVKNYREDSWITGAILSCNYDSSGVVNKTDYNNGTYSINFTAPIIEGDYVLVCNVTKDGNFGNVSDTFTVEPAKSYVYADVIPSNPLVANVEFYSNGSFIISVNATNIANATAYSTNITLELLSGWDANKTMEECGDLEKGGYCIKAFNITVPSKTLPGNYSLNVTAIWKNPDGTLESNKTQVNVTILPNPKIEIKETKVSGEVGDGVWSLIGNFTILSLGNDDLKNITFSCASGTACQDFLVSFIPEEVSTLLPGSEINISVNITVPLAYPPGTYVGVINVTAYNDGYDTVDLEVYVPYKTNVSLEKSISSYTAYKITQKDSEAFEFQVNATNIGNGSARLVNISLTLPSGWTANSTTETCGNLIKGAACSKGFNVTIPSSTSPGSFTVNITVSWLNPDNSVGTNETSINVVVASNPLIDVSESSLSGVVADGEEKVLGNFTILSIGNDDLKNITFTCASGTVCQDFNIEFLPTSVSTLKVNSSQSVMVKVKVPLGYPVGTYNGSINVSAINDGYDTLLIEISVPSNRSWDMSPTQCFRTEYPEEGVACEVTVKNLGNDVIDFLVTPEEGNYTKVTATSFSIPRNSSYTFKVTYNVSNVSQAIYNSTFIIDAIQENAKPDNKTLFVSLLPYVPPSVSIAIVPNSTEQNGYLEIFANVTDKSGSDIAWTKINVTRPDNTVDSIDMQLISKSGSFSQWYIKYPDSLGNTTQKGTYTVTVFSQDNVGNLGNATANFTIYPKLLITFLTLSDKYLQGDTGSIYYVVRDIYGNGLNGTNVTFIIVDPTQNITYCNKFQTNEEGIVTPLPNFVLSSDAPVGNYTLISNSTYYDPCCGTISVQKNTSFKVEPRTITVTGLFADIETAVVWYPDNIMKFGILVYNGEGRPVDPTTMTLNVSDPAGNPYFSVDMSQMTRVSTGYYTYSYAMPINTPSGMFLAVLNVSKGEFVTQKLKAFRVAHGGPYDLWIKPVEYEVTQGSYLDFIINIENKGEVTQDVFLEWWVSSEENKTYFYDSAWILTPQLSNQTLTRQAYIFTDQPLGTYYLNVRMTYDTVQPPLVANTTFVVLAKQQQNITYPTAPQAPAAPSYISMAGVAPTPTAELPAKILISSYRSNITLARGMVYIESVTVKNVGKVNLNNVSLILFGIPSTWYNITPESYKTLAPDNSSVFLITFKIPEDANLGSYKGILSAFSGAVSDQKEIVITIYKSTEEVLKIEIGKLKEEILKLENETKNIREKGYDVSSLQLIIDEAKLQLDLAEENLKKGKADEAIASLASARRLIERAKDVLSQIQLMPKKAGYPIPIWMMILIVIAVAMIMFVIAVLLKKKEMPQVRPYIISIGKIAEIVRKRETGEELKKEKERLMRVLSILEKEKAEGLISERAYMEMKKNIEEKLKKLK